MMSPSATRSGGIRSREDLEEERGEPEGSEEEEVGAVFPTVPGGLQGPGVQ